MHRISTIISYCTNDFRFIAKCIEEAKIFSKEVIVVVCDHFFDGTPENRHLLEHTYAQHSDIQFVEFSYLTDRIYSLYHHIRPKDPEWAMFWAATTRYIGFHYIDPASEYVLFLDSDEIVNGKNCLQWLKTGQYQSYEALRFGAYLYALKPTMRAKKVVNLPLFVKKMTFLPLLLMNELERIGAFLSHLGPKKQEIVGTDQKPFVHHYSWVRTKEECLLKTRTWGHRNEEDWEALIESAFCGETKNLFGSSHEFEEISEGYFDPFKVEIPLKKADFSRSRVIKINDRDLRLKEVNLYQSLSPSISPFGISTETI
jgi:hypothetical protein